MRRARMLAGAWRRVAAGVLAMAVASAPAHAAQSADLEIAIALSGTYQVGKYVTYTVTVKNNGPAVETGTITVGGSVASGLALSGISGNGWTCSANATLGTCSYKAPLPGLAAKASAPPLSVSVYVQNAGEKTVTATVTGSNDDKLNNNTATRTDTAYAANVTPPASTTAYALTEKACAIGATVGDAGTCPLYTGPTIAGQAATIYLTAKGANDKAKAPPEATVAMQFALRCLNPATSAGVKARIGATELKACTPQSDSAPAASGWSGDTNVSFATGQASAELSFQYADVGQVELHLREGSANGTPAVFVSKPWQLTFRGISRGGNPVPSTIAPDGQAFAMAGEALLVEIGALAVGGDNGTDAPNFGKEATRPAFVFGAKPFYTDAVRAADLPATPAPVADDATWKRAAKTWSVNASWGEAGATTFTLGLANYLGAEGVTEASKKVGRFYPAYFTTEITAPVACGAGITCPARSPDPIGVAFSGQPFSARVVARNVQNEKLENFRGAWFRTVNLSAVTAGGAAAPGTLAPATLSSAQFNAVDAVDAPKLTHTLPNAYVSTAPRANNWSAPATIYLHAQAQDGLAAKGITSDRSRSASDEDGLVVVSGRLRVPNALGTDLLRTPLALHAEYWNGNAWLWHRGYTEAVAAASALRFFTACTGTLAGAATPCNAAVEVSPTPASVALDNGAGLLWLRAPGKQSGSAAVNGRHHNGSVSLRFDGWTWLPSTVGRVEFGSRRSPLVYVREVY